jgi:hypothetical protein
MTRLCTADDVVHEFAVPQNLCCDDVRRPERQHRMDQSASILLCDLEKVPAQASRIGSVDHAALAGPQEHFDGAPSTLAARNQKRGERIIRGVLDSRVTLADI